MDLRLALTRFWKLIATPQTPLTDIQHPYFLQNSAPSDRHRDPLCATD